MHISDRNAFAPYGGTAPPLGCSLTLTQPRICPGALTASTAGPGHPGHVSRILHVRVADGSVYVSLRVSMEPGDAQTPGCRYSSELQVPEGIGGHETTHA